MPKPALPLVLLLAALLPLPALAAGPEAAEAGAGLGIDRPWVALAVVLVALMQIGFLFLECGFVRSKTTINVAQKNIVDFSLSVTLYWLVGFMLMFGPSAGGLFGFDPALLALDGGAPDAMLFLLFQAMFCGTAATVVSGAVAERCGYWGYVTMAALVGLLIYPVVGHWAWSGIWIEGNPSLLGDLGFLDFAGATVVHGVGAWVALAAVLVIGPRLGRFGEDGRVLPMQGHNPVLSGAGALLLLVGWIGFNGGSLLEAGENLPAVIGATIVGAVAGCLGGLGYGMYVDGRILRVERPVNGLLGGLVGITAGADLFGLQAAALAGFLGGVTAQVANDWLLARARIDDVVGAIGVHGAAGAVGTLLVALLAPVEALPAGGRLAQLGVQAAGVVLVFAFSFGLAWALLAALSRAVPFRVSPEAESMGLNTHEHGVTLGTGTLQAVLARMLERGEADAELVPVDNGDENGELSELFNLLLLRNRADTILDARAANRRLGELRRRQEADAAVVAEINRAIEAAAAGDFSGWIDAPEATATLRSACAGINRLFDAVEEVTGDLDTALGRLATGDFDARMEARGSGRLAAIAGNYNRSVARLKENGARSSAEMSTMTVESQSAADIASDTLADIERASSEVLGIVGVIEEIASKTNMLALNASIEASRAGAHGAAFAVVAGQVRDLAGRVREASAEIDRISRKNADLVRHGAASVGEIRAALTRIEARVGNLMDQLAEAA